MQLTLSYQLTVLCGLIGEFKINQIKSIAASCRKGKKKKENIKLFIE